MKPKVDLYIHGASEVITCIPSPSNPLGRIPDGAIAIADGHIVAVGQRSSVEERIDLSRVGKIDAGGKIVAPGFVDCHTHLVFGRSRVLEYALKMTKSVAEIEATGLKTGIPASIQMTREASEDALFEGALDRLNRMMGYGATTVESKSGYGIRLADELKQLRVNRRLGQAQPVDVVSTFLGAHDFPPEIDREDPVARQAYINELTEEMIPRVAEDGLAEFCDIYCDTGYYTAEESEMILRAGMAHGLAPRIHTDAYANVGGSSLAVSLPAVSADHLNYTSPEEMHRMAEAGVVGVVLPALDFAVAHPDPFDARAMLDAGMTLALGTNLNPGNWTESMQVVMQLACRNHGMSPEEAMLAATAGAARAICRQNRIGCLTEGYQADLQLWDLPTFEDVVYRIGHNAVCMVLKRG
ncbi:MAG: imidazolonepropionase, partial [Desulfosarcina sp.]|nr:imidazolonepropionase [Desulfosarcina sp.]MBC2767429.1 imidazolonepropionase [Desulfosarcina sp.]